MFNFKKTIPYILSIVAFYIASILYFNQELLQNKSLPQSDVLQFEGMAKASVDYRTQSGEETLWNDAMFSGVPDYLIATGVPVITQNWVKIVLRGFIPQAKSAHLLFTLLICFWIMLLTFEVPPYLALLGALAFSFGSYNIINIEVGHVTKTWAIAFSSLVLGGMNLVFRGQIYLGFGLTSMGLALQIGAPHYQITFYLIFVCIVFSISELIFSIREQKLKEFIKKAIVLFFALVLGVLTSTGKLWITQEYTPYSIRGASELATSTDKNKNSGLDIDYAFNWSQGVAETFTLIVPYIYGGSSSEKLTKNLETYKVLKKVIGASRAKNLLRKGGFSVPLYHGSQPFTGGPLYVGAIICFLFVFGLLILDSKQRYWLLTAALITMMISWGKNFETLNFFLFDHVPGFNKFRSVSMALSLTFIIMALTAILGLNKVFKSGFSFDKRIQKKFVYAFGITAGLSLLIFVFAGTGIYSKPTDLVTATRIFGQDNKQIIEMMVDAWKSDRESLVRSDGLRSFFLILLAASVLWFALKGKLAKNIAIIALSVLIVGELWNVDKRYLYDSKFQKNLTKNAHKKTAADTFILKDNKSNARVLSLNSPFNEASVSYYHKSIGGYFAAKLRRYNDLIERQIQPEMQKMVKTLQSRNTDFSNLSVLNMLDAKYIMINDSEKKVVINENALGKAWFINKIEKVQNAKEEIETVGHINTATTAVIDISKFDILKTSFTTDSTATIKQIAYSPRRIKYKSKSFQDGLAVFSEIYYPKGWTAKIDGKEIEIKRANYVLRCLEIPAGDHTIDFEFNPKSYKIGSAITRYADILVFLSLIMAIGVSIYKYQFLFKKR